MSARIRVKLFATLQPYTPDDASAFPIAETFTVSDLVARLALPRELVKLIFVNSRRASLDTALMDGDQVGIFPPVGGG